MKKGIIIHPTLYAILNALSIGTIVFFLMTWARLFFASSWDYFHYTSITPTKDVFTIWESLTFESNLERYKVTDMKYEDTLLCWLVGTTFKYSSTISEYNNAPIWKKIARWRYQWELPLLPMTCQLHSRIFSLLPIGLHTSPQEIYTSFFSFTGSPPPIPAYVVPKPKAKPKTDKVKVDLKPVEERFPILPTIQEVLDTNKK